ncbi:MAG: MIP/aquaporin family protein [Actinomycetota bacterium]
MKRYLSESVGAFFLVFVGAGSVVADVYLAQLRITDSFGPLGIALAHGLALAIALSITAGHSRGFVNPVVTIALFVARRLKFKEMLAYVASQLLGAVAAAFLVRAIMPNEAFRFVAGGVPGLGPGVSPLQGTAIEVVLTFFLTYTIWAMAVNQRVPKAVTPLAVGAVTTFSMLVGATFTGGAMNPARWLGPALAAGQFGNWAVWIAGPLVGALLGSLLYETFFLEPAPALEATADPKALEPAPEVPLSERRSSEPEMESPSELPALALSAASRKEAPWPPLPPVPKAHPQGVPGERPPVSSRPPRPPSL